MDLITALKFLNLSELPSAWVDAVWDAEFTEMEALDDAIEEELSGIRENDFRSLYQSLLPSAANEPPAGTQGVWALLGERGVTPRSLVAALAFFVLRGKAKAASGQQRINGLQAGSLYLLLLAIPGSIANQVFHQVLMDTCSDLASHCWPQDSVKKRKKEGVKSSQAESKRSKPHRRATPEMEVDEDEEDEEEEEIQLSAQELVKIRDSVVLLVQSLLRLLQKFPLKDKPQSASNCAQIFSKLIYFEPVTGEISFSTAQDISKLRSIPVLAFYGLRLLCSSSHGNQEQCLQRVFHRLLYVILMMSKGGSVKPSLLIPSQAVLAARDHAIHFVCHMVEEMEELAMPFLQILLQHICFQIVEKSEYRSHGAQAVGMLTAQMACGDYATFIKWLFNYSRMPKMVYRLFSVDVVMVLLEQPERIADESLSAELLPFLSHSFLIQRVLYSRQGDSSPTVRGHALSCLAQCLELPKENTSHAVHTLFSTGLQTVLEGETTERSTGSLGLQTRKTMGTLGFRTVDISSPSSNSHSSACEGAKENLALLVRRIADSKANVRKSALQTLVGLLKHGVIPLSLENLSLLSERSRDPALSVKKKALQCLGELLTAKPEVAVVQKAWLQGVVPAVVDSESSVQEKALELLEEVLLKQVKPRRAHMDAPQRLTWDLVNLLCTDCQHLSRYFSRAFSVWSKQQKFTPALVSSLISHTEGEEDAAAAWLLLAKVVGSTPTLCCGKILDAWDHMLGSQNMKVMTRCHILSVMGDIAQHLNDDTKSRIIDDLMLWLKTFSQSLEVITAAVETLFHLGHSEDIKQTQAFMNQHCGELVSLCESHLSSVLLSETRAQDLNHQLMVKHLHTLGVASLHCPARVNKRTVLLVESILTSQADRLQPAGGGEELPASQPLSQFRANSLPTKVRAHGVITLGKLCLQHRELTEKYLPVLARELELGSEVAVRNNVVVILCDLCVRYTNMVDSYIPNVSACLRDDQPVIRKQTLIMLTNLLQEEYVKWKGSLFFRFMAVLVDPEPEIASLCEYCLVHLLLKKNPAMFSQHFIECIFHFNSYSKHKTYNKFSQTDREKVKFSLKGPQHREKRFRIYCFLLEHFNDSQRVNITIKINQTLLACFADEELPLDADGADILTETFSILSLKELKLRATAPPAGGAADEAEEPEEPATMAKAVQQAVQSKFVSQVQKKDFIENSIPIIISLKGLLEERRSPVLRDLMSYLQVAMKEYRCEVSELFAADEQLAAELDFNLQNLDKEQEERAREQEEVELQLTGCSLQDHQPTTGSVRGPLTRPRLLPPDSFATPQPPPARLADTDRRKSLPLVLQRCSLGGVSVMPRGEADRAISTPHRGVSHNITFGEGVSAIFRDRGTSGAAETSVLNVLSEDQAAEPRQWNVQSPLRQKKRSTK